INNATNPTYSATTGVTASTNFRFTTTCSNGGGQDFSNVLPVALSAPSQCYCTPVYTYAPSGCADDDNIESFTLTGENGTSISDLNTGCSTGAYDDNTGLPAVSLAAGFSYSGSMSSILGSLESARIWIDAGDDGFFDATDEVGLISDVATTGSAFSITVPATANPGLHRMRVRLVYNQTAASIDPCGSYVYGETHDYMANVIPPPTCPAPSGLTVSSLSGTGATLSWTVNGGSGNFTVEYGPQGFVPGSGTFISSSANSVSIGGLSPTTPYAFYVRSVCSSSDSSTATGPFGFTTLIPNDVPSGAIILTVNGGCSGTPYDNTGATHSLGEPIPGCRNNAGFRSVWFRFIAPASGFVRVTNDYAGGTIGNTRIAVFAATDATDFSSFANLACDDNNGIVANKSLLYLNGLTPGSTYYVLVDNLTNGAAAGTFCITVDETDSSMLATGGACSAGQGQSNLNTSYSGWISLVDISGKLIANVRQTNTGSTSPTGYTVNINKHTGAVRQAGGIHYLNRNFMISSSGATSSPSFDLQLFFINSELAALQAADPGAALSNLNITRQSGSTCNPDFVLTGTNTLQNQTASGTTNNVSWLQSTTPGFSNFYIMAGANPLAIKLIDISAVNLGTMNRVDWTIAPTTDPALYTIESSTDGVHFNVAGSVQGKAGKTSYSYLDHQAAKGMNYYRLKTLEASGNHSISRTVMAEVRQDNRITVTVYPNPVSANLNVIVTGAGTGDGTLTLSDLSGRILSQMPVKLGNAQINLESLASGVYHLHFASPVHSETIVVTKQ
ncbi:MAG: T9SS type A sorting domain-containing protein, partial [Sphingobacteriales bacterium]